MNIVETLNNTARSKLDYQLFGVCGGFARATETPAWVWRAGFLLSIFFGGFGGIVYLVLLACMPAPR